jgi:hypothetical protein
MFHFCNDLMTSSNLHMLHAGYYENPEEMNSSKGKSWQQAQFDHIDAMLKVAGVKKADQVRLDTSAMQQAEHRQLEAHGVPSEASLSAVGAGGPHWGVVFWGGGLSCFPVL